MSGPAVTGPSRALTAALALLAALVLSMAVGACDLGASGQPEASGGPSLDGAPSVSFEIPSFSAPVPQSPVAGVVVSIDSQGLDKVRGFTLRTRSGVELKFVIGQLDNGADFPPGHLAEHQATLQPILVWFKAQDGKLVVYHLEDAG